MEPGVIQISLYLLMFALVLVVGVATVFVYQLLGMRFQRPKVQQMDRNDFPAYLLPLYAEVEKQLKVMGFQPHHDQLTQDIIAHERSAKYSQVLVSRKTGVFAELSPASTFLDMPGVEVDFWSIAKDGAALVSLNGRTHALLGEIPGVEINDPLKESLRDQYKAHIEKLKIFNKNKKLTILNAANYIRLRQKLFDSYFLGLINNAAIVSTGNNQFGFTFSKAVKFMFQMLKGKKQIHRLIRAKNANKKKQTTNLEGGDGSSSQSVSPQASSDVYPVEAEVQAYFRLQSARELKSTGVMGKLIMFVLTMILSYFAFGLMFSFNSVFILLGVITIHELGHFVAMFAFRYRDLQIFFVPLFGAATLGKKEDVAVWKQVIVYLMGPLPGIVIGIVLLYLNQTWQAPLVYETAIIMLVINYLNLLPFVPLDGGHVIRLTIMERFPTGKLVFSGISGAAFALGGYMLGEPMLWVLAFIMLSTLPVSFRETSMLKQLNQSPPETDVQTKLTRVFQTLKLPKFSHLNFADKFNLIKSLSEVLLQRRHCSIQASISLTGLYVTTLLLTPPAVLMSSMGIKRAQDTIAILSGQEIPAEKNWDNAIATEFDLDKRFELLLQAAKYYAANDELSRVPGYLQHAEAEANTLNKDDKFARLFHTYSFYYQQLGEDDQAEMALKKAIDIGMQASNKNYSQIASQFQDLAALNLRQENEKEYESNLLTALLFAKQITKTQERYVIISIIDQLLENFYKLKEYDTAVILLQQTETELSQFKDEFSTYYVRYIHHELGWLYEAQGNSKAALEHFNTTLGLIAKNKKQKKIDMGFDDPLEEANVLLAIATIHFRYGNLVTAEVKIGQAEKMAKLNYFTSLDQYIKSFLADSELSPEEKTSSREANRWMSIYDVYQQVQQQVDVATDG